MEHKKFAWLPVQVTSGLRVWLCSYWHYQTPYDFSTGRPPLYEQYFTFTETDQERTWRLLKQTAVQNRNVWNDVNLTKEDKL